MTAKSTKSKTRPEPKKAIFAGSFNPFTIGHASIVDRGLKLFDQIFIVVAYNSQKEELEASENVLKIQKLYNNDPRISVIEWNGLLADLATSLGVDFLLRGVRNATDFDYEFQMADINRRLTGIETILLPAEPYLSTISSSMARELMRYDVDVSGIIPS